VAGIRVLTVIIVKDTGSRNTGVARGQSNNNARRSDRSLYIKMLEIKYTVNESLDKVLTKKVSKGETDKKRQA
jgi:hypothetical protein